MIMGMPGLKQLILLPSTSGYYTTPPSLGQIEGLIYTSKLEGEVYDLVLNFRPVDIRV